MKSITLLGDKVEQAVFDREELLERVGGDEALCLELVGMFLSDAPNALASLNQALVKNDMSEMQRQAHSLKGAAAYISARSIKALATSLEGAARDGRQGDVKSLVEAIEREIGRLEAFTG